MITLNSTADRRPDYLDQPMVAGWQRRIYEYFSYVIDMPSFDQVRKEGDRWDIVVDRRAEIANIVAEIMREFGIGVGLLVLHAQQLACHHIPTEFVANGHLEQLAAAPSRSLVGKHGERVIHVPIRQIRDNHDRLADLNILKPRRLWDRTRIVSHEADGTPCSYCSAAEISPTEVVVRVNGSRYGLARNYCFAFTWACFGNPLTVVHAVAWHDDATHPMSMSRAPETVSDLVELTRQVNDSIEKFFAHERIDRWPVISGVSNGFAGNTVFHQHYQLFVPEFQPPITAAELGEPQPIQVQHGVSIRRLAWPAPIYKITAANAAKAGLLGNDLTAIWQQLSKDQERVCYKDFPPGYQPQASDLVLTHTENIYVPGDQRGRTVYIVPRDRRRVHYRPAAGEFANPQAGYRAEEKKQAGVLEATGTPIIDDVGVFERMQRWNPEDISRQVELMAAAIAPDSVLIQVLEDTLGEIVPS